MAWKCTHSLYAQQYFIKTLFTWPENVPIRFTPINNVLKPCLYGKDTQQWYSQTCLIGHLYLAKSYPKMPNLISQRDLQPKRPAVVQHVRYWPADLAIPGSRPAGGGNFFNCKQDSIALKLFIISHQSSWYDWNTVKQDIKLQVFQPSIYSYPKVAFSM